ncbi:MAG: AMP-binding protein, partial [Myxococcota bacterium]
MRRRRLPRRSAARRRAPPTLRPRAVVDALPSPATLAVDPGPPVGWGIGTSGSTGRSRFVALTEASVAFVTGTMQALVPYRAGERVLCALPLHHTYGLSQLWLSLRAGATLVLAPTPALPGDLARLAAHADVLPAVP